MAETYTVLDWGILHVDVYEELQSELSNPFRSNQPRAFRVIHRALLCGAGSTNSKVLRSTALVDVRHGGHRVDGDSGLSLVFLIASIGTIL